MSDAISAERIERAARAMAREGYRMDQEIAGGPFIEAAAAAAANHFWQDYAHVARAALAADAAALASAERKGRVEGMREAQAMSPVDDDAAMFSVHRERERVHAAINARIAELEAEASPAPRESIETGVGK